MKQFVLGSLCLFGRGFLCLFSTFLLCRPLARAQCAGAGNTTSTGANAGSGGASWINPNSVQSTDGSAASVSALLSAFSIITTTSDYINVTNLGLSVPFANSICGVAVTINRQTFSLFALGTSTVTDNSIRLIKGGSMVGTEHAATGVAWPTSLATTTYGSSSDLWGTTLTPADVNASNFGVAISTKLVAQVLSVAFSSHIEQVTVTVYSQGILLPLEFGDFTARRSQQGNTLTWSLTGLNAATAPASSVSGAPASSDPSGPTSSVPGAPTSSVPGAPTSSDPTSSVPGAPASSDPTPSLPGAPASSDPSGPTSSVPGAPTSSPATAAPTAGRIVIQRSSDGVADWQQLAVLDLAGNTNGSPSTGGPGVQSYTDLNPLPSSNFYRLCFISASGSLTWSPVKTVAAKGGASVTIHTYPNPFTDQINITSPVSFTRLILRDAQGQILCRKEYPARVSNTSIPASGLPGGIYFVQVDSTIFQLIKK